MERLENHFINYEVSTGTLNELHLIVTFHKFLKEHYQGYQGDDTQVYIDQIFNTEFGDNCPESIKDEIAYQVNEALPDMINKIAPIGCYFGSHAGSSADIGFWPVECNELIEESSIFAKMVFLNENKKLENLLPIDLNDRCIDTQNYEHDDSFIPFEQTLEIAKKYNHPDKMSEYLSENLQALNWVIENFFWSDYQKQIDKLLGSQDITQLWSEIMVAIESTQCKIDGIQPDEAWSLRESCSGCEDSENLDDYGDKKCNCSDYEDLNNVWIVSDKRFYECLEENGAMVYETDSLYLWFQADFSGTHYDSLLRKTWIEYGAMAWLNRLTETE